MFARALFLLLLTANCGLGAWLLLAPPAVVARLPPTDDGVAALKLLDEHEDAVADAAELVTPTIPVAPARDLRCVSLGPFPTQSDLRRAMTALTPVTERIQFRETHAKRKRGFWVYLPAFQSRSAALAAARELSAKGVRDYYVVTAGDQENTISLGLFRDAENAKRRQDEVRAMGLTAQLHERTEETPEYWLDYAFAGAEAPAWQERVPDRLALAARELPCGDLR